MSRDTVRNGKGSRPRTTRKYQDNYDFIFRGKEDDSFEAWQLKYPQGNFFDYCCDMEEKYGFPTIGHAEFFDPKQFPNISTPEKAFEAGQKAAENLKKFIP